MAEDPKQSDSFLRRVARFVANPTTDWKEISSRQDNPESELAKAELRAMIERKRRNDFVRKRELDMLRRLRRQGLTPEQLAAAGEHTRSVISDAERVVSDLPRDDIAAVKNKIDQIEQQMVKEGFRSSMTQRPPFDGEGAPARSGSASFAPTMPAAPPTLPPDMTPGGRGAAEAPASLPPLEMSLSFDVASELEAPSNVSPPPLDFELVRDPNAPQAEEEELPHDPELDEAVMAFANGDNENCERSLIELTGPDGARHLHSPTWLVRLDFYRAIGNQAAFENLAVEYVHLFGLSAPQWVSLPRLVVEGRKVADARAAASGAPKVQAVNWSASERLDLDGVTLLRKRCETAPLPWMLDWGPLKVIEHEARGPLTDLMREWCKTTTEMRWMAGNHLLEVLRETCPVGERDTDTGWWMLRLEALRAANRPDQFDEAAIDYCVTYEVSPPSWEPPRCRVRMTSGGLTTLSPSSTQLGVGSEPVAAFLESSTMDGSALGGPQVAHLELMGQLSGDLTDMLGKLTAQIADAKQVQVACPRLIRLDFIAAGDVLNW
ncbi:MAG: hypothetical protein ACK5PH_15465, partial [Inhella sp.]|uniref:hypothetical protein n=1 Tax=Inhella sp. TaxID=1921806 RepID=UPI00391A2359